MDFTNQRIKCYDKVKYNTYRIDYEYCIVCVYPNTYVSTSTLVLGTFKLWGLFFCTTMGGVVLP